MACTINEIYITKLHQEPSLGPYKIYLHYLYLGLIYTLVM